MVPGFMKVRVELTELFLRFLVEMLGQIPLLIGACRTLGARGQYKSIGYANNVGDVRGYACR